MLYSLILHGRKSLKLHKLLELRFSVKLGENGSAFSNSFSSSSDAVHVSLRDCRKGENFTVSYLVDSLGLASKLAESISRRVRFDDKGKPDSVLFLLRSHGFTDSQISTIVSDYPRLLVADAEKSLAPKLKFLQSRGTSSSELTEILSKAPKILGMREDKTISLHYDFVKEIIEADKSPKLEKLCHSSLPQGSKQENKIRNISVLREVGVPQKLLLSLLVSNHSCVCGKDKFEESLKKIVGMGFDPTTSKFVVALAIIQGFSGKTTEAKVSLVCKTLGFAVGDVWEIFSKWPHFLIYSEKKILNSTETFLNLGFTRGEFARMVKRHPKCIGLSAESVKKKTEFLVKEMYWPLQALVLRPQVISYSMEKRIVPRCNVIKALLSKGLLGERGSKLPPMSSVLSRSDEMFLKRYVMKHDDKELVAELMAIFTGERVSLNDQL